MTDTEDDVKIEETFQFDQLSDHAKDKARDEYRSGDYPYNDWWDGIYEDAVRMGALIGIEIDQTKRKNSRGYGIRDIGINFSGFCSQGDGACFHGDYHYSPDAVKKIETECNDEELLRIAHELTKLQLTRRLLGHGFFSASITTRGNYSHSGSMSVELRDWDQDLDEDPSQAYANLEDEVQQLMRSFADWIYERLEKENDYLDSDECIDQYLVDEEFDEDGEIV